ncbi:phage replisome organizer N-terminal domain-containing protein [Megasphaera elsdenii]|uniref:phage replisome organizer N-terminal domain-containing protein n=1 Tax=Megasphaera elsdenii TaxID=907 RepID=UPI004036AF8E
MLCNDITNFDYLRFGTDFINDKAIKALKSIPNGKSFTWVYGEILVMAAETDGIITTDETFPTIADQIAAQLYMITPEEVDKVLKYFTGIGYIKVEGRRYKFLQVPAFIKHETGAAARKENQRQNQKQDNTFQGTSLSPNTAVEQFPKQQQTTKQYLHRERDNNNNKQQQIENVMKRISLFESWGIESTAAKSLALLPHVQAYSDNFLKELLAYASKRSKDNLPGYLRSMLEMPNLVLYSRSNQRWKKVYDSNCPKCHGTGTYTVKVDNGNDYKDNVVIHCDCWKKYRTGGAAK